MQRRRWVRVGRRVDAGGVIKEHTPNLKGFIHAAGILRDNLLEKQEWADFEAVFAPKARGALYVHSVGRTRPRSTRRRICRTWPRTGVWTVS